MATAASTSAMPVAINTPDVTSTAAHEAKLARNIVALPTKVLPGAPGTVRFPNRLPSTAANPSPNAMQKKPSAPMYGAPMPNENSASVVSDTA